MGPNQIVLVQIRQLRLNSVRNVCLRKAYGTADALTIPFFTLCDKVFTYMSGGRKFGPPYKYLGYNMRSSGYKVLPVHMEVARSHTGQAESSRRFYGVVRLLPVSAVQLSNTERIFQPCCSTCRLLPSAPYAVGSDSRASANCYPDTAWFRSADLRAGFGMGPAVKVLRT